MKRVVKTHKEATTKYMIKVKTMIHKIVIITGGELSSREHIIKQSQYNHRKLYRQRLIKLLYRLLWIFNLR